MEKQYRITYKIFPNKRLKKVSFHNESTYPLYIQITYRRRNLVFKSYYFDLFSKERYGKNENRKAPKLEDIIDFDKKVLDHLINHSRSDSTIEQLQEKYYFYSLDLCTSSEETFNINLFLLLSEMGTGAFARACAVGSESQLLYDVIQDMAKVLKPDLYENLMDQMLRMGQFYYHLYSFVLEYQKYPYLFLSVLDWETGTTKARFEDYLHRNDIENPSSIVASVDKWVAYQQKER